MGASFVLICLGQGGQKGLLQVGVCTYYCKKKWVRKHWDLKYKSDGRTICCGIILRAHSAIFKTSFYEIS